MPDVISANRLSDGVVVFLAAADAWVERIEAAAVFAEPARTEDALERARAAEARNEVVDVYAFAVKPGAQITPVTLRDTIRATGPTIAYLRK